MIALWQRLAHQLGRERKQVAPRTRREPIVDQADHDDRRELEALGSVVGEDVDGIPLVHRDVSGRRIVASLDERVQLRDQEREAVVAQQGGLAPHDLEEARDVGEPLVAALPRLGGQAAEPARRADEVVEELTGGALRAHPAMLVEAGQEARHDLERTLAESCLAGLRRSGAQRALQARSTSRCRVEGKCHVARVEPEHLRRGQVVAADRVLGIVDRAQEADQQAHLGLLVQAGGAGEAPWNASHVQRAEDRVGVAVGAHQDGVVARPTAGTHGGGNPLGDGIGLVRARVKGEQLDARIGRDVGAAVRARHESLVEPFPCLEAVRVVVPDQPIGRVQDRLAAPEVVGQDHARSGGEGLAETEDVRECRPAEPIDALVVVPHHREVGRRRPGQQLDQLELGMVRVLKFVDEDVPIAPPLRLEDGGMLTQQPKRKPDLVPEVDPVGPPHQLLVRGVAGRQLDLLGGHLGQCRVIRCGAG